MNEYAASDLKGGAAPDADELRQSEQRLRLAIAATGIGIWDVDVAAGERQWSPEFRAICGLPPDAEADSELFSSLIHPVDRDRVNELYRGSYASPEHGTYEAEFRIIRANDGIERWVATTGRIFFDAAGKPLRGIGTLRDIDERRRIEEAHRLSEERYRALIQASSTIEWRGAAGGGMYEAPLWESYTGQPAAEHIGTGWLAMVHPEDRTMAAATWAEAHRTGDTVALEYRVHHAASGRHRWVRESGVPIRDGDGVIREWVGTVTDIDERKQAEEALRISEERLRVALAAGRMGIWWSDLRTGRQQWDARQYELFGVPPETEPSRQVFLSLVHPDDIARIEFDMSSLPPPGTFLDSECRIILPDGSIRWITAHSLVRYDARGEPAEMIGVNWDVTAEKEAAESLRVSEERHRLAIAANNFGTWDYDLVTGDHLWSPEFFDLWGLPADAPAEPKLLRPLLEDKDWQRIRSVWSEAAAGDGRVELECQIRRRRDGARRWVQFRGQMFFGKNGKPVRAVGIMMDASDRRQAEERQRLLLNELNHRVKNTLATVQAIVSQTLRATPEPEAAFERVQSRLMALSNTHNLLNATHWEGAALTDILDAELRPYRGQGGRIVLIGGRIELDAKTALALGLIVHELATNAAKYGSLSVQHGRVEVTWNDWGPGEAGVELLWREFDGPLVEPPRRRGFGSRLIERSAGDLRGTVDLDFLASGLACRLAFPLRAPPDDPSPGETA